MDFSEKTPFPKDPFSEPDWRLSLDLVDQPLNPPYRAMGYSYTYCTSVFQVSQGSRYTPPSLPYLSQGEGVAGGYDNIATQAALWRLDGIALYWGIAEIVSPIAVNGALSL